MGNFLMHCAVFLNIQDSADAIGVILAAVFGAVEDQLADFRGIVEVCPTDCGCGIFAGFGDGEASGSEVDVAAGDRGGSLFIYERGDESPV